MKLEQLMEGVPYTLVQGSPETEINDIIYDSRKAAPGLLFVCIVGTQRDSHEFAADCAAKGVSALVIQHDIDLTAVPGVTVVKVESSRYAMALMSANLFGNPNLRSMDEQGYYSWRRCCRDDGGYYCCKERQQRIAAGKE